MNPDHDTIARTKEEIQARAQERFEREQAEFEDKQAMREAREGGQDFLPLHFDATNPSPNQGWAQRERAGFDEHARGDMVLVLAFVHHLAIARNIPLADVIVWVLDCAPDGVVEFVSKSDPMVQSLQALREDIFPDYGLDHFRVQISNRAEIVAEQMVSASDRSLINFVRRV